MPALTRSEWRERLAGYLRFNPHDDDDRRLAVRYKLSKAEVAEVRAEVAAEQTTPPADTSA